MPERTVSGQILSSGHAPTARLGFDSKYKYVGGQRFILYGVADAEKHFFVDADEAGSIRSFYWVQFEHFLPGKGETYNYSGRSIVKIGPPSRLRPWRLASRESGRRKVAGDRQTCH